MTERLKNIFIGLFVVGAIAIMISLVLFLKPTIGDGKKILAVRFTNIAGISTGTRVTFAGKPIGEVIHIRELPGARNEADEHGRIYMYQLTLKIDSSVDVYSNDEIAIKTTGLMGEKSIAILPKASTLVKPAHLITDQIVYASSTDPLENTFHQVSKTASELQVAIRRIDQWFSQNENFLSKAISSFGGAMTQVDSLLMQVDQQQIVDSMKESLSLLNENLQVVKTSLQEDQLLYKVGTLTEHLNESVEHFNTDGREALSNLNQITRDIASGSGTFGRFVVGDDFYLRLSSLMNKGEALMNDINHYGLLFQYNKQWQKTRTKKAHLLRSLDSPQEFRNYFEGEVDSMTTSLGRLTELLEKAGLESRDKIIQSPAFKQNFASLMRQVQALTDSLKLYNEGLVAESHPKN